jgi:flagella basal body P-ring formation protein FlgA
MSVVSAPLPTPPASPQPRRIATPGWLDLRLVLGVVLVLASVLIGAKIVSSASRTYASVAATRDLAAGTVLTRDDVRLAQVQLPGHGRGVYLRTMADAVGKRLERAVSRGELLAAAAVAHVREQTTLTVPLAAGAAPKLRSGQRIEVWVSSASCSSVVLLPDVTVQSVHADSGGSFANGSGGQDVVISVDPADAGRVIQALAIDEVKVRAGILVGHASPSATASAAPSAPAAPSSAPPPTDLAACASASPSR